MVTKATSTENLKKLNERMKIEISLSSKFTLLNLIVVMLQQASSKDLLELLSFWLIQEKMSYVTTTMSFLATTEDAEDVKIMFALRYMLDHLEECAEKGAKDLNEKMKKKNDMRC